MKTKIIFALLVGIVSQCLSAADLAVAGITVKIQDAATGKPISGMHVYRRISTQYAPFFTGFFKTKTVDHPADCTVSGRDGIAIFPEKKLPRKKSNEHISFMEFDLNLGFDLDYDSNDALAHEKAFIDSWKSGGGLFSKNGQNDALRLSCITYEPPSDVRYEVMKSENPRCALVRMWMKFDFKEQPGKTIVIKLGNATLIENGIKTGVTLEPGNNPSPEMARQKPASTSANPG